MKKSTWAKYMNKKEMHMVNLTSGKILSLIYSRESVSKAKLVKMIKTDNIHC